MWFKFLTLVHICAAFPLKCPEPAQWALRANGHCSDPSKYFCLQNDLIKGYSENCTRSDFQQPGRKAVLRGGIDAEICSVERYQPFPIRFYTNATTNCIFLKSFCNAEGQVVYDYGNRNTDRTCRCDYRRGYTFLVKPKNPCFCKPLQEDCSCYLSSCSNTTHGLSPDYLCINKTDINAVTQCRAIMYKNDNNSKPTEPFGLPSEPDYNPFLVIWKKRYPIVELSVFGCTIVVTLALSITQLWGYRFRAMFTAEPNQTNFIEGEKFKLTFSVYLKDTSVVWYKHDKDNHEIEMKDNISNKGNDHIMTIEYADLKDSGQYAIVAGKVRKDFTVTVQAMFTAEPKQTKVVEGEKLQLTFSVYSKDTSVVWYKHDKDNQEVELKDKISNEGNDHIMTIEYADLKDSGQYAIVAGKVRKEFTVDVQAVSNVIKQLDKEDRRKYVKLIQDSATEQRHFARIMIVGKEGVGKTCLLRRLLDESINDVKSTDGIDIVVRRCKINIDDGKWTIGKDISDNRVHRMQNVLNQKESMEKESLTYDGLKMDVSESSELIHQQYDTYNAEANTNESHIEVNVGNQNSIQNDSTTIPFKLETSKPIVEKRNVNTTDEKNISLHKESTDIKAIKSTSETSRDINQKDNTMNGYEKQNKRVTITDTETTLKKDDCKLDLPKDLMSQIFSTSSTSNIPTNHYALCGLWDFAGQKEFYATHQVFLTSSAIYLVVADMKTNIWKEKKKEDTKEPADETQNLMDTSKTDGEFVDFWFDSIHCYKTADLPIDEASNSSSDPPVIVVFTGADKYEKESLEKRKQELNNQLITVTGEQSKYKHFRKCLFLSNLNESDKEFVKLRKTISDTANKLKGWGETVPLKWILLEHLIEINKKKGKNFMAFNDMVKLANHKDVAISKEDDVILFLCVQSKVGNIIYFRDIENFIILEPQWLVDAFRCLVSNQLNINDITDERDTICLHWQELQKTGKISDLLITTLFKQKKQKQFLEQKADLLKVMKKFDILVDIEKTNTYIMPSMMPSSNFKTVCETIGVFKELCKRTSWFCLKFKFLPPVFFNHLSAWLITTYTPTKVTDGSNSLALYREICVFDFITDGCDKLLMTMSTDTIAVQVVSFDKKTEDLSDLCTFVRKTLLQKIEDLKKRYSLNLSYEERFKCSAGKYDINTISLEDLKKNDTFQCLHHQQAHESKLMYSPWTKKDMMSNALFKRPLKSKTTMEGLEVSFECEVEKPYPIEWYKDDKRVYPSLNVVISTLHQRVHKLTILQTTLEDKGRYEIKILNILSSADLDVKEMPSAIKEMDEHGRSIFLEAAKSGIAVRFNIRIILVGKQGVGKTCLLRRLMREGIDDVESTDGINMQVKRCKINLHTKEWIFNKGNESSLSEYPTDKFADCGFWDFSGQKEFYATHQTFLSRNAIYLLVVDVSDEFEMKTFDNMIEHQFESTGEYIDFWLDNIHCYTVNDTDKSKTTKKDMLNPPVILIGTGIDKVQDEGKTKVNFQTFINDLLQKHPKRKHIRKLCFLSNTIPSKDKKEFETLRNDIFDRAHEIPKWGDNLPTRWILLEKEMERFIDNNEFVISYDMAKDIASKCSFSVEEVTLELDSFLKYEHEIGNLIYFENIKSHIILEPKWLVDVFTCFFAPFQFQSQHVNMSEWSDLQSTGCLSYKLIDKLFTKVKVLNSIEHKAFALQIMEQFDIIVKPITTEITDEYYMPCMMEASEFNQIIDTFNVRNIKCSRTSWFGLQFNFLPPAFFNHILVTFLKKYSLCSFGKSRLAIYRGVGVFDLEASNCRKLVVCLSENSVAMQVWQFKTEEGICYDENRKYLIQIVDLLQQKYRIHIPYQCFLKCPDGTHHGITERIYLEGIKNTDYHCSEHAFHALDELRRFWFDVSEDVNDAEKDHMAVKCQYCEKIPVYRCYECINVLCNDCCINHDKLTDTEYHTFQSTNDKMLLNNKFDVSIAIIDVIDMKALPGGLLVIALVGSDKLLTYSVSDKQQNEISVGGMTCGIAILDRNTVIVMLTRDYNVVNSIAIVDIKQRQVIQHVDVTLGLPNFRYCPIFYTDDQLYIRSQSGITVMDMSGTIDREIDLGFIPTDMCYDTKAARIYCIDDSEKKLICIDRDGDTIFTFTDTGLSNAQRLTIDNEGYVLILCHEDFSTQHFKVYRISPDGKSGEVIITGISKLNEFKGIRFSSICIQEDSDEVVIGINGAVYTYKKN